MEVKRVFAVLLVLAACGGFAYLFATNQQGRMLEGPQRRLLAFQSPNDDWENFHAWMRKHMKVYETVDDLLNAQATWVQNQHIIDAHNAQNYPWSLAMNHFGDLSREQFKAKYLGLVSSKRARYPVADPVNVPEDIDWRQRGAVTSVKNQKQCGSCWAFSAVAALEGAYFLKTSRLELFSEQQLVDCSGSYGNNGCEGGLMDYAFEYYQSHKAERESRYPYTAQDDTCVYNSQYGLTEVVSYYDVADNELALKQAVALRPVSVAIEADQSGFQFYSGGVFDGDCGTNLDHGVTAVGYGITQDPSTKKYWLVKNSWGSGWGEQGYIRLARSEATSGPGKCGIAMQPSYPVV